MVSISSPEKIGDTEAEVSGALEELIGEFGVRSVLGAVLGSSLAKDLERCGSGEAALRVSQVILRQIAYSSNPQLEAEIMAIGCGVILNDDETMTKMGKRWGLTRAAISKRVVNFVEENGLPPSQFMRSEKDRETYSMTNRPRIT